MPCFYGVRAAYSARFCSSRSFSSSSSSHRNLSKKAARTAAASLKASTSSSSTSSTSTSTKRVLSTFTSSSISNRHTISPAWASLSFSSSSVALSSPFARQLNTSSLLNASATSISNAAANSGSSPATTSSGSSGSTGGRSMVSPLFESSLEEATDESLDAQIKRTKHPDREKSSRMALEKLQALESSHATFSTENFRISPRKLNLLARQIRTLSIPEALIQMKFSKKGASVQVYDLLKRIQGAIKHDYGSDPKKFFVLASWVGKGRTFKKVRCHGRGRFGMETRFSAHISIAIRKLSDEVLTKEQEEMKLVASMMKRAKKNGVLKIEETRPVSRARDPWDKSAYTYVSKPFWTTSLKAKSQYAH